MEVFGPNAVALLLAHVETARNLNMKQPIIKILFQKLVTTTKFSVTLCTKHVPGIKVIGKQSSNQLQDTSILVRNIYIPI